MRGYRFVDAVGCQISLRMMPVNRCNLRGKQCMSDVDPFAIIRQHAPRLPTARQSGHFCREMPQ
jgi:hypothetical protein